MSDLKGILKAQLEEACEALQLPKKGNKPDLFASLVEEANEMTQKEVKQALKDAPSTLVSLVLEQKQRKGSRSASRSPARKQASGTPVRSPGRGGKRGKKQPTPSPEPRRGRSPSPESSDEEAAVVAVGKTRSKSPFRGAAKVVAAATPGSSKRTPNRKGKAGKKAASAASSAGTSTQEDSDKKKQEVVVEEEAEVAEGVSREELCKISFFRNPFRALKLAFQNEILLIVTLSFWISFLVLSLAKGPHDEKMMDFKSSVLDQIHCIRSKYGSVLTVLPEHTQQWVGDGAVLLVAFVAFGVFINWMARSMYVRFQREEKKLQATPSS